MGVKCGFSFDYLPGFQPVSAEARAGRLGLYNAPQRWTTGPFLGCQLQIINEREM